MYVLGNGVTIELLKDIDKESSIEYGVIRDGSVTPLNKEEFLLVCADREDVMIGTACGKWQGKCVAAMECIEHWEVVLEGSPVTPLFQGALEALKTHLESRNVSMAVRGLRAHEFGGTSGNGATLDDYIALRDVIKTPEGIVTISDKERSKATKKAVKIVDALDPEHAARVLVGKLWAYDAIPFRPHWDWTTDGLNLVTTLIERHEELDAGRLLDALCCFAVLYNKNFHQWDEVLYHYYIPQSIISKYSR